MKKLAVFLALAFVLMPAATLAQSSRPDPSTMRQMHDQMTQLYHTTRTKMLDALSPQHRQLLANVVGQLAISPNPDRRAAAAQLDAALTPNEKQAVLSIHQNAMDQMHTMMQQAFPNAPQRPERSEQRSPSAGELLLMVASDEMHPMRYRPMGPGGPPMGPRMPSPAAS